MSAELGCTAADLSSKLARLQPLVAAQPRETRPEVAQVLEQARELGARSQEALALIMMAGCHFYQGEYREMLQWAQEALSVSRQGHAPKLEARALSNIGLAHQRLGSLDLALRFFLDSLRLAQQQLDPEGICRGLSHLAFIYSEVGEHQRAHDLHVRALQAGRESGNPILIAEAMYSLGEDYTNLGEYERALTLAEQTLVFTREHGLTRFECATYGALSRTLLLLGRAEVSLQRSRTGLRLAEQAGDQESVMRLRRAEGQALMALGRGAEEGLLSAQRMAAEAGNLIEERGIHEELAQLYAAQGAHDLAYAHLQRQLELSGELRTRETRLRLQGFGETPPGVPVASPLQRLHAVTPPGSEGPVIGAEVPGNYDPLTGLPGRALFQLRLGRALEFLGPEDHLGLLLVDLDRMSEVNSDYGQALGDSLLAEVGHRLAVAVRPGDLAARVSGDQFMLLLSHLARPQDLGLVMDRVLAALREPLELRGRPLRVTASLGGVVAPRDGAQPELLFRHAELAAAEAKRRGGDGAVTFEPAMSAEEQRRRRLEADLRVAHTRHELTLHYQPLYRLPGRELCGVEALVRWQHPTFGLLYPGQFIELAEEFGLVLELGQWVLGEACRQAAAWDFPARGLQMSVNVSALQFGLPEFAEQVSGALEAARLPGSALVLELTERTLLRDEVLAAAHAQVLRPLGVSVALDDFGTGYSSLSMLHRLPLQALKVDHTFLPAPGTLRPVSGAAPGETGEDAALDQTREAQTRKRRLLEVMVALAHGLGMTLVAEGVEDEAQLELVEALGYDQAQGFWLSHPLSAEDFAGHLPPLGPPLDA